MEKVFVILGPTSSGKTSLALNLCKKYNGEIISADSRQIYKYMDIGTGKIPVGENVEISRGEGFWLVDGVKIWGYDLAEPDGFFSAFDYAKVALNKIRLLKSEGKNIFMVGGTGFYLDTVTGNVKPANIPPDIQLRKTLEQLTLAQLQKKLQQINKSEYEKIDKNNPVRLVRAIEKSLNHMHTEQDTLNYLPKTDFVLIGLTSERNILYQRVDSWLETVWRGGLLEETDFLLKSKYKDSLKLKGIVYKTAVDFLTGRLPETEAIERTKYDLHAYVRRQQTYFKKMPDIAWVDILQDNKTQTVYNMING